MSDRDGFGVRHLAPDDAARRVRELEGCPVRASNGACPWKRGWTSVIASDGRHKAQVSPSSHREQVHSLTPNDDAQRGQERAAHREREALSRDSYRTCKT